MRPRLLALPLVVAAALAAPGAAAQDAGFNLNFVAPAGWTFVAPEDARPGVIPVGNWLAREGRATHAIAVTAERYPETDVDALGERALSSLRGRDGVSDLAGAEASVCGDTPAFSFRYLRRADGGTTAIRHVLAQVGPTTLHASYTHPAGSDDRLDALDALETLCDRRIVAMRAPAGWRPGGVELAGRGSGDGFASPDGSQTLLALAEPLPPRRAHDPAQPFDIPEGARRTIDAQERCGPVHIRRTGYALPDGYAIEVVVGYRHGVQYGYTYRRPAAQQPDPQAEAALTSFCSGGTPI